MNGVRHADLPLHYGKVPDWLYKRMGLLGGAIIEAVAQEYGKGAVVSRLSDPFWFQTLGCVLGMDWHSSGITTSVMGALKGAINPRHKELGIYVCGGKGKQSTQTPAELLVFSDKTGLDGKELVRSSKLTAKVDNTAIQDGYQIYLHTFIVTDEGEWAVVQQGMNDDNGMARRYHWHSAQVKSFVEEPHTFIYGQNQGQILNLTDVFANTTKTAMLEITKERPVDVLTEVSKIVMPRHHELQAKDVDLKRLGSVLTLAHNTDLKNFEELLMLEGVGPRTIQSLALVSEVIHGTPSRFSDPARFTFAHGGKDGHPFPVPLKVYDETIEILKNSVEKAKIGNTDKQQALKSLTKVAQQLEKDFIPDEGAFETVIEHERNNSYKYSGRTVMGYAKPPKGQLTLL
ncbi:MAG: DUF763 domain-containing protein [Bacteroidetes bacterium]|nr:MAG: DUF763 domain-containing protein [Bacteroidota bacterium]